MIVAESVESTRLVLLWKAVRKLLAEKEHES